MVKMVENSLFEYELSEEEQLQADQLGTYTVLKLQTLKTQLIKERAGLTIDPHNIQSFIQIEAEIGGKLSLVEQLLMEDINARDRIKRGQAN